MAKSEKKEPKKEERNEAKMPPWMKKGAEKKESMAMKKGKKSC